MKNERELLNEINEREKRQEAEKIAAQKSGCQAAVAMMGCYVAPFVLAVLAIIGMIILQKLGIAFQ